MTTRWAIVYNPVAGSYRARALERIEAALRAENVEAHFFPTERRGHATELARTLRGFDRLAVYGGDGSLNEAANGLKGRDLPLAFLPGGTANVMAHELGLPRDPARAAAALARGTVRPLRPGVVDGRVFLLMVGFGFDGDAVRRVSPMLKERLGKAAYVLAGLEALMANPHRLHVTSEGSPTRDGIWVVVSRARRYGGGFTIHPRAGLLRESLGLTVVGRLGLLPFMTLNLGLGIPWAAPRTSLDEGRAFRVTAPASVHVQVDGDYLRSGESFDVELADHTIPFCFPPGHA